MRPVEAMACAIADRIELYANPKQVPVGSSAQLLVDRIISGLAGRMLRMGRAL